jgi:trehalose 6-phosphate synthase
MRRHVTFFAMLLGSFVGLAAIADTVVGRLADRWLDDDLTRRARLAVLAARPRLVDAWDAQRQQLGAVLADLAHDDRVVGLAACDGRGELVARSAQFPGTVDCGVLRDVDDTRRAPRSVRRALRTAGLHLSIVDVPSATDSGAVLLIQDASFAGSRHDLTRGLLMSVLLLMAIAASLVTIWFSSLTRRRWVEQFQRALAGEDRDVAEFRPLLRDVRQLARALADEQTDVDRAGRWSPERLRDTMNRVFAGERLVVLANREPYIHNHTPHGIRVMHPASGLVTALEPVLRACSGVWVAHGSGSADRAVVDRHDRIAVPEDAPAYLLRRVWLSPDEEAGYYYGVANEALWPLCHVAHARPHFRSADWAHYRRVNERFARAVCEEAEGDDPIILVQDYHFALAPRMIRERLPRATIITFWHIPWPNAERIGICPWRDELLDGLLGSSILAFHTQQHCNHFLDAVDQYVESRIDREATSIVRGDESTLVRSYPISVAWPVPWMADSTPVPVCRASLRARMGLAPDALVGLGVDRLDYTKGIEERLGAVDALLEAYPEYRGRFTFVQVAAPSRTKIARYQELERDVEAQVAAINARWGSGDYRPIRLVRQHVEPPDVFEMMRAADLLYVSSLHDGMNLVAKEFVAARDDERGVLVLSQFTGAARELTEALVVNPYDLPQAAAAMARALSMSPSEQQERMAAMRRVVSEFNVYRWAGRMLLEAADLRRRQRVAGRLGRVLSPVLAPVLR